MRLFHRAHHRRSRGQGLVELAMVLPVLLLLLLGALDLGRAFLGWITITGAARTGAAYAAAHPTANWSSATDTFRLEYERQIRADTSVLSCALQPIDPPVFPAAAPGTYSLGSPVQVGLACDFTVLTPIIGQIVGNPVRLAASETYPIRAGTVEGVNVGGTIPSAPPSVPPSPSPDPSVSPAPSPTGCTVPLMTGMTTQTARAEWLKSFTGSFTAQPNKDTNIVNEQSLVAGTNAPCTADVTVKTRNP